MKPVSQGEHPPHIGLTHPRAELFGQLTKHRDGTGRPMFRTRQGTLSKSSLPMTPSQLTMRGGNLKVTAAFRTTHTVTAFMRIGNREQ